MSKLCKNIMTPSTKEL